MLTTVADETIAERTARTLIDEGWAACVSRLSVRSTYQWKGAVEDAGESMLVIKTFADLTEGLERRLAELSSYEVPEFIALEASHVAAPYLGWMHESCRPPVQ